LNAQQALSGIWQLAGLPEEALGCAQLTGHDPVYPSSFALATAAQSTIAAAALAACEFGHLRGAPRQDVRVDSTHAAVECTGWFSIDKTGEGGVTLVELADGVSADEVKAKTKARLTIGAGVKEKVA